MVTNFAGGTFSIGALTVRAARQPSFRRARRSPTVSVAAWTDQPLANGELVARIVRVGGTAVPSEAALTVEGVVTDYQSTSSLKVAGTAIDASAAQFFGGAAGDLRNGKSVRASGTYNANVLRATRVEFLSATTARVELTGTITTDRREIPIRHFTHAVDMAIVTELTPSEGENGCNWKRRCGDQPDAAAQRAGGAFLPG